ncbi:MAG: lipoate--protein ligase family protein [Bacteroidota bacterium]|nr:lipoate--protein ligase family protein [Bacteroidota bacterium]
MSPTTPSGPFVFLDTGAARGGWNMDFDVDRAHAVDAGTAPPTVRVYRWEPWCISLGRHQDIAELDLERVGADGLDVVRRPTGGRAILHAEECTYSVVMPSEGRGIMDVYRRIGDALVAGLRLLAPGIELARSRPDFPKLYREPRSIPCFSSSARYEIEADGRKLVGSAQRRIGGTVLQHGSILIGPAHLRLSDYLALDARTRAALRSDLENHTITLTDLMGRTPSYEEVRDAVRTGFERAWGIRFSDGGGIHYLPSETEERARP